MIKKYFYLIVALFISIFFYYAEDFFDSGELNYNDKPVRISKHSEERMQCREVELSDIKTVLDYGVVNSQKSASSTKEAVEKNKKCPLVTVLEGRTENKEALRVVIGECDNYVNIITVIDLKNNYDCPLSYNGKPVEITRHARERMKCRYVEESDINIVLKYGKVNTRKSEMSTREAVNSNKTCKTVTVLEGRTDNKELLRVVVAECETYVNIVTVIDLKNDYGCK